MKLYIDESAWVRLLDRRGAHHAALCDLFYQSLQQGDKLFTHNIAIGLALSAIKQQLGPLTAGKFSEIIEEAYTGTYLNILWIGRRTQKEAIRLMRKHPELALDTYDYASFILMKRRRISTIITLKKDFDHLGMKVIPEIGE